MTGQFDEDRTIDLTLAALGNATPPHGMHDRLLQRLQRRELQADAALPPRRFFPQLSGWAAMRALSATTAAALLLTAILLQKPMHRNAPEQNSVRVEAQFAHRITAAADRRKLGTTMPTRNVRMATSPHSATLASVEHKGGNAPVIASVEESFPPPPMPLTEQERLLLRLAHHGDAIELADLNTEALDAAFEAQKTQFNDFFYIRPKEPNHEDQPQH